MNFKKKAILCSLVGAIILTTPALSTAAANKTDTNFPDTVGHSESARVAENQESLSAAGVSRAGVMPSGSYKMNVNINGRRVLDGRVFGIGSTTYVPLFKFCDWLGVFSYSYDKKSKLATVSGDGLQISAKEGTLYIVANGRYFYTVDEIIEVAGEIYVPIRPITKALNSKLEWSNSDGEFKVYSGDTSLLPGASRVYRDDEIYWLARIINAEAGGEPMQGKLAVGNVILNRVRSSAFPNTIYSVIFDRRYGVQFSPTANGTIYKTPSAESVIAAKMCIEGYSLSSDILYFFNPKTSPSNWISKNRQYAFTVKNHAFYY